MSDVEEFLLWAFLWALTTTGSLLLGRMLVLLSLRRGAEEARNLSRSVGWTQDALICFLVGRAEGRPAALEIRDGRWVVEAVGQEGE